MHHNNVLWRCRLFATHPCQFHRLRDGLAIKTGKRLNLTDLPYLLPSRIETNVLLTGVETPRCQRGTARPKKPRATTREGIKASWLAACRVIRRRWSRSRIHLYYFPTVQIRLRKPTDPACCVDLYNNSVYSECAINVKYVDFVLIDVPPFIRQASGARV